MTSGTPLQNADLPTSIISELRFHGWCWKSCGAMVGLVGGIILPLIGLLMPGLAWFIDPDWHGLHMQRLSMLLLLLAFPLLIFGAHCLDLMDQEIEKRPEPHPEVGDRSVQLEKVETTQPTGRQTTMR